METSSFLQEFIAGNLGGIMGMSAVYPLDTAKVRLQVDPQYTSMRHVITSMAKKNGVVSIYRGLPSPALGVGLTFAVSFTSYSYARNAISNYQCKTKQDLTYLELMIAGAFTGFCQAPVRQVFSRVKSVMQAREKENGRSPYKWTGNCAIELIRTDGWRRGLFQGQSATFLREIPQYALYYASYEYFKYKYSEYISSPLLVKLLAGGTAGVIQWLPPIYCFDVIKSRMQTAPKGLTPALLLAFPLNAIIFVTYDLVITQLQK